MAKSKFSAPDGYKFVDTAGRITAVLDNDGRFTLRDLNGGGTIEIHTNWSDFVKTMGDAPVVGDDEDAVITQLEKLGLGTCHPISRDPSNVVQPIRKETTETTMSATATATKKKAAPAPKKVAAKKEPKELKPCVCGAADCKAQTTGNFAPGHDARVHGWGKKIARGDMKFSEIPATAAKYLKTHGIVQGVKAKEA